MVRFATVKKVIQENMLNIFKKCIIYNPLNKNGRTVAFVGDSHNLTLMKSQNHLMKVII